ncbi:hypothetical protein Rsub_07808 [Raphidocelis subcapitata]|uniref:Uncharacterized protein n=1 Tax=Raphidocelis subcapitata TaxID=307507 RepID=A0A2V0PBX6_9CHLO|nr:hypothetical protein Rsub_07808 [Raphidocelis subcapitata]|eukprot:GBF95380.1 hypothetical protein Rsub_07808 [Raphidocelis subcapitata]
MGRAQEVRQRAVGHERYVAQRRTGRAPTRSEVAREADALRAARLPRRTAVAVVVVAALFCASCLYWIVVGLMPSAAPTA